MTQQQMPETTYAGAWIQPQQHGGQKSFIATWLFAWLLGGLGVDRFYLGKIGTGVLKLITFAIEEPVEDAAADEAPEEKPGEEAPVAEEEAESSVPAEYTSALTSAETYSDMMHMSKAGNFDQPTSEYGGQFTSSQADYAIDHLNG